MAKEGVVLAVAMVAMAVAVSASDFDPLQDFCIADLTSWTRLNGYPCRDPKKATDEDFVYRGLRKGGDKSTEFGGPMTTAFVQEWSALSTQGISWARIDFAVNGLNNLHWHPHASEILYCQEGTLFVGFVDATDNRFWYNTLQPGDLVLFPRGLLHFELNVGNKPALAQIAHNSQDGGHQREGHSTFGSYPTITDNVLRKGFDLDEKTVQHLKEVFKRKELESLDNVSVDQAVVDVV